MSKPYYSEEWAAFKQTGLGWRLDTMFGYTIIGSSALEVLTEYNNILFKEIRAQFDLLP